MEMRILIFPTILYLPFLVICSPLSNLISCGLRECYDSLEWESIMNRYFVESEVHRFYPQLWESTGPYSWPETLGGDMELAFRNGVRVGFPFNESSPGWFFGDDLNYTGYEVDLLSECVFPSIQSHFSIPDSEFRYEFHEVLIPENATNFIDYIVYGLNNDEVDFFSSVTYNTEREEYLDYSEIYLVSYQICVRSSFEDFIVMETKEDINDEDTIIRTEIGVCFDWSSEQFPNASISPVYDNEVMFDEMTYDPVAHIYCCSAGSINYYISNNQLEDNFTIYSTSVTGYEPDPLSWAFKKTTTTTNLEEEDDDDDDDPTQNNNIIFLWIGIVSGIGLSFFCFLTIFCAFFLVLVCLLFCFFAIFFVICFCCFQAFVMIMKQVNPSIDGPLDVLPFFDEHSSISPSSSSSSLSTTPSNDFSPRSSSSSSKKNRRRRFKRRIMERKDSFSSMMIRETANLRIKKELFIIDFKELEFLGVIGSSGGQATIYRVQWRSQEVAFKCYENTVHDSSYYNFEREAEILMSVNHPFILKTFGASIQIPRVGIVMEYCENGDLKKYFFQHPKNYKKPFEFRKRVCYEIICGMEYLHSKKIIHRDLKSENVLLNELLHVRLMDFGLSRCFLKGDGSEDEDENDIIDENNVNNQKTKKIGTSVYMAPEVTLSGYYDEKADVFSFGILLYEIMTNDFYPYGKKCFNLEIKVANDPLFRPSFEMRDIVILEKNNNNGGGSFIEKKIEKRDVGLEIQKVCKRCWDGDPKKRPSFSELMEKFKEEEISSSSSEGSDDEGSGSEEKEMEGTTTSSEDNEEEEEEEEESEEEEEEESEEEEGEEEESEESSSSSEKSEESTD